jgi:hypothetical protein
MDNDLAMLKKDRTYVDRRLGIVRDRYGREMSRNGVPNPYYVSPEQVIADSQYFDSIKDDEEKRREYFESIAQESEKRCQIELEELSQRASKRVQEILLNPTEDYYKRYAK